MKISRHELVRRKIRYQLWRTYRESQAHPRIFFLQEIRRTVRKRYRCKPSHTAEGKVRAARAGH
jgi:hypothetical protein